MDRARRGWSRRTLPVLAALAAVTLPVGWHAAQGRPAPRSAPVARVALVLPSQHALLSAGRVTASIRGRAAGRARVRLLARTAGGGPLKPLAAARVVRLVGGRTSTLTLGLTPAGIAQVATCDAQDVIVRVSPLRRGKLRSVDAAQQLHVDPPACGRFFAPDSVWNSSLPEDARLDPGSDAVTGTLLRDVNDGYARGLPPSINTTSYSTPIYTVAADQPASRVILDKPAGVAPELVRAFSAVPIPAHARPAAGTDAQMIVWQPSTDTLWEFWSMKRRPDGWHAAWGGRITHTSTNPGVFREPVVSWGATATSLSLAGGLITASELRRGRIDHALALALPSIRRGEFSLPAQRTDGQSDSGSAVPAGARFRLDPRLDLDRLGLAPAVLAIARAAQRYGMIVRDRAAAVVLFAEDPAGLGENPYPALFGGRPPWDLLRSFPWQHLQLMPMQIVPASDEPNPSPVVCGVFGCR
jgi:hypothetical protein